MKRVIAGVLLFPALVLANPSNPEKDAIEKLRKVFNLDTKEWRQDGNKTSFRYTEFRGMRDAQDEMRHCEIKVDESIPRVPHLDAELRITFYDGTKKNNSMESFVIVDDRGVPANDSSGKVSAFEMTKERLELETRDSAGYRRMSLEFDEKGSIVQIKTASKDSKDALYPESIGCINFEEASGPRLLPSEIHALCQQKAQFRGQFEGKKCQVKFNAKAGTVAQCVARVTYEGDEENEAFGYLTATSEVTIIRSDEGIRYQYSGLGNASSMDCGATMNYSFDLAGKLIYAEGNTYGRCSASDQVSCNLE